VSPHILQVKSSDQKCFTGTKLQIVIVEFAFDLVGFFALGKAGRPFLVKGKQYIKEKSTLGWRVFAFLFCM
jgi:hypothetical protein